MAKNDANPPMPDWSDQYQLVEVDVDYLSRAVKPKQFIHIDQSECIMCEGCVDICPWKCIHMVQPPRCAEAEGTEQPRRGSRRQSDLHHRRRRVHPLCALRRPLSNRGLIMGKLGPHPAMVIPTPYQQHGYAYGMRF